MNKATHTFRYEDAFRLELGGTLQGFSLSYTTLGRPNRQRSNVIWVCHALTGSSDVTTWWNDLFESGGLFDADKYFIVCANSLGGCYGSTGPLSVNPETGKPFYHDFPLLTPGDSVNAFDLLRQHLGITRIHTLVGGSLGGQHVLEWAIRRPDHFDHIVPIGCNALHSPWGIAFNEAQRMAIEADSTWQEDHPKAGIEGLKAARAMGMISYRAYATFQSTQAENGNAVSDNFRAASYQRYQGNKLAGRFDAFAYWTLSKMMDAHNVGRNRKSPEAALAEIKARTLVIAIDSDILFPVAEQRFIAEHVPGARLETIKSLYGHDGFLVEFDQLEKVISDFYGERLREESYEKEA